MRAASITNRGGRKTNEDSVASVGSGGLWCFVVCDGLGGQSCGEVASDIVSKGICEEFEKNPQLSDVTLRGCIETAAARLEQARIEDEEKFDMASTVAALITDGKRAIWANVGDSRIYYIHGGEIVQVTNDHSVAFMEFENGDITYEEIRKSPNQNKLLRAVSGIAGLNPDISEVFELSEGDAFLMCTDGFWEYVTEDDIENTLKDASEPADWLDSMLKALHKNEIEKNDNYSAVAVMM